MANEKDTELFTGEEVIAKVNIIKTAIEEFANTVDDINNLIEDTIQAGETSTVNSETLGKKLKATWDDNKSNVKEFQENFENWVAVISLITATNNEVILDVANIYNDKNINKE